VLDGGERPAALRLARDLRRRGLAADLDYAGRSLKGQLTQASRSGARWTVLLGADGRARVRERGAEDRLVELDRLADTLGR
jgi:histidyl-tRNA synthetase